MAASAVKSSHAGSLSSGTTGGGGAGRDPKRPSRQGAAESVDTSGGSDPSCAPLINHQQTALAVSSILEVLYGGGIAGGGPRSAQGGGGVVTSSGGASSQHSGGNNPVSVGPAAASFSSPLLHSVASVGAGLATSASTVVGSPMALAFSSASQPPPAYNIAMALLLLHQRSQSLLEAQADTQQRITAELKEELSSMRQEITDTRNAVNQVSAEVDALRVSSDSAQLPNRPRLNYCLRFCLSAYPISFIISQSQKCLTAQGFYQATVEEHIDNPQLSYFNVCKVCSKAAEELASSLGSGLNSCAVIYVL